MESDDDVDVDRRQIKERGTEKTLNGYARKYA